MRFSGYTDKPGEMEITVRELTLVINADVTDFAGMNESAQGNPRKYVREWKICK